MGREIITAMSVIAGCGFLINAVILLYVYRLSVSKKVSALQEGFVTNRCTAEVMRVALHFMPYGFELDPTLLSTIDIKLAARIRHSCDDCYPNIMCSDRRVTECVLKHCCEMLKDQRAYHKRSMKRFEHIVVSLEKGEKVFLYIGFISVIAGGILQFLLLMPPIKEVVGDDMKNFFCSLLNALAMIIPGWSGYFSSKLTANNFRFNYDNHENMLNRLNVMIKRIDTLTENNEISAEVAHKLFDDITKLMLKDDITHWTLRYRSMNKTSI